jgi:hypothetical protein
MSKRRKSQDKPKSNSWAILVVGLLFAGGLILVSIWGATSQMANDAAASKDVTLGTPLQIAAPTRMLGDVSALPRGKVSHVDVVYFHRTQRCTACLNAGSYSRETVETYFASHLQRGVMSFRQLNVEFPENAVVTRKYDASGSSLYLGVLMSGIEYLCPIEDIWFYTNNKASFMTFLQKTLTPLVGGL